MTNSTTTLFTSLLVICCLLLSSKLLNAQCHIDDWTALKALYESTDGDNWNRNNGWEIVKNTVPPVNCNLEELYGITLNNAGRVYDISLSYHSLSGYLPSEIGNLSKLHSVDLSANELTGNIPQSLGNLSLLSYLNLGGNNLSGIIPAELANLTSLERLFLRSNQLTGEIPVEFANLSSLENLFLDNNQLTGEIPHNLGNLPLIRIFSIESNNLTGSLPMGLGSQTNLSYVNFNDNNLSGCYPPSLAALCDDIESGNDQTSDGNNFDATWEDFCTSGSGVCDIGEEVNFGCTDPLACNYNSNVNYENGSCIYYDIKLDCPCGTVPGCMDPEATNYNAEANCDNGFCSYTILTDCFLHLCSYEQKLLPGQYSIGLCDWTEVGNWTGLKKTCTDGTFTVTENTLNGIININEDGYLEISQTESAKGTVKISLVNENGCSAEWIFNIIEGIECYGSENSDNMFLTHTWLSNFVNPSNCNTDVITEYTLFVPQPDDGFGSVFYIETSEGAALYDYYGKFLCADYAEGETSCLDIFPIKDSYWGNGFPDIRDYWNCGNTLPFQGCTDLSACNYDPSAQINDDSCEYLSCNILINPIKIRTTNEVILSETQIKFDLVIDSLGLDYSADGLIFTLDMQENYRIESIEVISPVLSVAEVDFTKLNNSVISINRINKQRLGSNEPIISVTGCIVVDDIPIDESSCSNFKISGGTKLANGRFINFDNIYIDIPFSDCSPYGDFGAEGENWLPMVLTINPQNCHTETAGLAEIKILEEGLGPFEYILKNEQGIIVIEATSEEKRIDITELNAGNYELTVFDMEGKKTTLNTCIPLVTNLNGNEICQNNCIDFVIIPDGEINGIHKAKKEIEIKGFVSKTETVEFNICD